MPYCPNCGSQVKAVHHYCGSCGQALSEIAETESDSPMAIERDGFLSLRSVRYVNELLAGEREIDHDSVSYAQLSREVKAAFADFARLAVVNELNIIHLWAANLNTNALSRSVEDMNSNQFQDWLAAAGLSRTLRLYDNAFNTEFEEEFNDQFQKFVEYAKEELEIE